MMGFYFIDCDIDGRGKKWRLAWVSETASVDGSYLWARFIDGTDFEEALDVYRDNGSRIVGPFSVEQLLTCIDVAEFAAKCGNSFLPQRKPGERPITAGCANGLATAARHFEACKPNWKRENCE